MVPTLDRGQRDPPTRLRADRPGPGTAGRATANLQSGPFFCKYPVPCLAALETARPAAGHAHVIKERPWADRWSDPGRPRPPSGSHLFPPCRGSQRVSCSLPEREASPPRGPPAASRYLAGVPCRTMGRSVRGMARRPSPRGWCALCGASTPQINIPHPLQQPCASTGRARDPAAPPAGTGMCAFRRRSDPHPPPQDATRATKQTLPSPPDKQNGGTRPCKRLRGLRGTHPVTGRDSASRLGRHQGGVFAFFLIWLLRFFELIVHGLARCAELRTRCCPPCTAPVPVPLALLPEQGS